MKYQKIFFCCFLIGILFCGCENQKDNHLIEAAMAGDFIYVKELLEGYKYNQKTLDKALFGAIKHKQFFTVRDLLLHGAKFPSGATFPTNADRETKNSFLLFSALYGKTELVDFLLKNGGDASYYINLSKYDVDFLGVLECAVMADNTFIVKLLLESGAREFFNDKALSTAIEKENLQIVKMLLEKKFSVYSSHIEEAEKKGNQEIIQVLKDQYKRKWGSE